MLITFVVVYNRNLIAKEIYPDYKLGSSLNEKLNNPINIRYIDMGMDILENGYLIVISGKDTKSELFSSVNRKDKTYAYAGLVFIENNYPFVYTIALPTTTSKGGLVRDSFENYVGAKNVTGFGIYKFPVSNMQVLAMQKIIRSYYQKGVAYDNNYQLSTDEAMYPSEFVFKVMTQATKNKKFISYTNAGPYQFVSIDDLFLRPQNQKIYSAVFN
ncbi:hypothetical protein DBR32_09920 [Taibaiella sp. KBW10]|nr:hypothetical protein DBR32_09920 [Taibaiella sp. KBW10]